MTNLNRDVKRLIVEAAIAAPNYGLMAQAKALLASLPALKLDVETRGLVKAMVYFGLYRPRAALAVLKGRNDEQAQELRAAITAYLDQAQQKKQLG